MSIGERLKTLRVSMNRTLREQSEVLDVSLNSIYRWEHDMVKPKISMLEKMAEVYDVSLNYLLQGDNDEEDIEQIGESNIEQQLLKMFRKMPENKKHKILGYIERIYIENIEETI
jgi:transcriptional regulator with XRE-family HTH domain